MFNLRFHGVLALGAALALGACSPDSPGDALPFEPLAAFSPVGEGDTFVRVCKIANNVSSGLPDDGTLGEWFGFEVEATDGSVLLPTFSAQAVNLSTYNPDVDCKTVWTNPGVMTDDQTQVTVTELPKPGFAIYYAYWYGPDGTIQDGILPGEEANSVTLTPFDGTTVFFKNIAVETPPPPPPPGGGEGCTPGYWKQPHHFDSWVGFATTDVYSDIFGVGPSISLLEGLELRGGKFNALVRHSVAALLSASSPDVSYDLAQSEIVSAVQDAFNSGEWQDLSRQLDELNNQGCPLN